MSFSPKTENLTQELINTEYLNAVVNHGEKYNSLHEGYAILLEEVEETRDSHSRMHSNFHQLWNNIKDNNKEDMQMFSKIMLDDVIDTISELAQVGAVLIKLNNTLGVKE